jgi:hypothetical protein
MSEMERGAEWTDESIQSTDNFEGEITGEHNQDDQETARTNQVCVAASLCSMQNSELVLPSSQSRLQVEHKLDDQSSVLDESSQAGLKEVKQAKPSPTLIKSTELRLPLEPPENGEHQSPTAGKHDLLNTQPEHKEVQLVKNKQHSPTPGENTQVASPGLPPAPADPKPDHKEGMVEPAPCKNAQVPAAVPEHNSLNTQSEHKEVTPANAEPTPDETTQVPSLELSLVPAVPKLNAKPEHKEVPPLQVDPMPPVLAVPEHNSLNNQPEHQEVSPVKGGPVPDENTSPRLPPVPTESTSLILHDGSPASQPELKADSSPTLNNNNEILSPAVPLTFDKGSQVPPVKDGDLGGQISSSEDQATDKCDLKTLIEKMYREISAMNQEDQLNLPPQLIDAMFRLLKANEVTTLTSIESSLFNFIGQQSDTSKVS